MTEGTASKNLIIELESLKSVLNQIPVGCMVFELHDLNKPELFKIVFVNQASESANGIPPEQIENTALIDSFPALYTDYPELIDTYIQVLKTQQSVDLGEFTYTDDRIKESIFSLSAKPISSSRLFIMYENISGRKQALDELQEKAKELERSNKELERYAYMASHDLKGPVYNLEGVLNELEACEDPEERTMLIGFLRSCVSKTRTAVEGIEQVARFQKGNRDQIEFNLLSLSKAIIGQYQAQIKKLDATISVDVPEDMMITGVEAHFRSIIANLISNALKYHAPERLPKVGLKAFVDQHDIVIQVSDNGIGISPKDEGKLFQMFSRLAVAVEGSGIGLYLVKQMVEEANGIITIDSIEGEGTTFTIRLKQDVS